MVVIGDCLSRMILLYCTYIGLTLTKSKETNYLFKVSEQFHNHAAAMNYQADYHRAGLDIGTGYSIY